MLYLKFELRGRGGVAITLASAREICETTYSFKLGVGSPSRFHSKQEGVPTPSLNEYVVSQITLAEAKVMVTRGDHAAQILGKAFPGVKIELIHYAPEQVLKARKGQN